MVAGEGKRIKTGGIWVFIWGGGGRVGKKGGDEGGEGEQTRSVPVRKAPYSVLLPFIAPGSFSCNLKSERQKKRLKGRTRAAGSYEEDDALDVTYLAIIVLT